MSALKLHPGAALVVLLALIGMFALSGVMLAQDVSWPVVALGFVMLALLAALAYFAERRFRVR